MTSRKSHTENEPEVRVQKRAEQLKFSPPLPDFETLKQAIYDVTRTRYEQGLTSSRLQLSPDIYEILNQRLVFKTAAHKEASNFITPFGNLAVYGMTADPVTSLPPEAGLIIIE